MTRPWVRGELDFLRSGPLWRVHRDAEADLDAFLARHDYRRIDLDGSRFGSRAEAHAQLAAAFDFPDWYGGGWDAFNDCLGPFVVDNDGALLAVVVHDLDLATAPATAAEVVWALLLSASGEMPSLGAGGTARIDLDVFVTGSNDDFDRP